MRTVRRGRHSRDGYANGFAQLLLTCGAASRAVYDWLVGVDGIGYWSRLDRSERCWAIYDHVPVNVTVGPLDPNFDEHRDAVRAVGARFEIVLPPEWG